MSTQTQVGRLWVQNTTVDNLDERELINDFTVTFNGTPVDNNNFVKLDKNTVLYTGPTITSSTVVITKVVGFTSVAVNQYYQRVVEALRLLTEGDVVIPDGSIVNADISPTAGIEQVKLALSTRLASLQGLTTAGLVQLAAGAGSAASIATAAEIRSAAGLGALATKNTASLNADVSGDSYLTANPTLTLGQLGGSFGSSLLKLANQIGLNGAQFETSIPLVDFSFLGSPGLGYPSGGTASLRFEYRPDSVLLSGNTKECQIFFDANPPGQTYFAVGNNEARIQPRLTLNAGLRLNAGTTLTVMLRATKTIAGTNPETITVTGAAVGDIVELSKPVNGEVTAPNTVTFIGTGLSGTLTAIVKRYT